MSGEEKQYFSKLNGYYVKDEEAHEQLGKLAVITLSPNLSTMADLYNAINHKSPYGSTNYNIDLCDNNGEYCAAIATNVGTVTFFNPRTQELITYNTADYNGNGEAIIGDGHRTKLDYTLPVNYDKETETLTIGEELL